MKKTTIGIIIGFALAFWAMAGMGCISNASAATNSEYIVKTVYHGGHNFVVYESAAGVGMALLPE